MKQIVIFSCTNRPESNTIKVSRIYEKMLKDRGVACELFDFRDLPHNLAFSETFGNRTDNYEKIIDKFVRPVRKFIFVVPEYNGSFPGILKTFLDSMHPREWNDKDACLVGVSDGRAGNLRGMEHLTGILNYLKMHVYHDKLPISVVNKVLDESGQDFNEDQKKACLRQIEGFLTF